jgi:gluconolactonase
MPFTRSLVAVGATISHALANTVPSCAQVVDQKSFNVLPVVPPPFEFNASNVSFLFASYLIFA